MISLLVKTFKNWIKDDPFTHSAAAAYYSIFSLPGLLIIIMSLAAIFFDQQQVEDLVLEQIKGSLGSETANSIKNIVEETQSSNRDIWGLLIGIATLLFGATGLFAHLQRSLNKIWEAEIKKSVNIFKLVKNRLISFSIILIIGFLLLISLSLTAALTIFGEWLDTYFSSGWEFILYPLNVIISFLIVSTLFSAIFKILPDVIVPWKSAIMGGIVSSIFFTFGENALNIYFELVEPQSSFGAAGSLILLMLWVSYSCMIVLIGAEFSKVYTQEKLGLKARVKNLS